MDEAASTRIDNKHTVNVCLKDGERILFSGKLAIDAPMSMTFQHKTTSLQVSGNDNELEEVKPATTATPASSPGDRDGMETSVFSESPTLLDFKPPIMSTPARKRPASPFSSPKKMYRTIGTSPQPSTPPRRKRFKPLGTTTTPELCRATKAELSDSGDSSATDSEDYEGDVAHTRSTGASPPHYRNRYKIRKFLETLVKVMSKPGRSSQPHDDKAKEIMRDFLNDCRFYHLQALANAEGRNQSSANERFHES